jgi:hypothetical protein
MIYEMNVYQSVPINTAVQRDKLYAAFIFGSLGIPMLWEGQEMSAMRGWANDGKKLGYRPVEWSMLQTERGNQHYTFYQRLIQQRLKNSALHSGHLVKVFHSDAQRVIVWGFQHEATGSNVVFVVNLSGTEKTITNMPWLATGNYYDVFDQTVFIANTTTIPSFTIPAYTAKIYSNKSNDELGIVVSVADKNSSLPTEYSISQNYPNPFNPSTTIQFALPQSSPVKITVFDALGREVKTVLNEQREAGFHHVSFDASRLGSGMYFYTITAGSYSQTRRMVLLK